MAKPTVKEMIAAAHEARALDLVGTLERTDCSVLAAAVAGAGLIVGYCKTNNVDLQFFVDFMEDPITFLRSLEPHD